MLISCGDRALIVLLEPTTTVTEDGVFVGVPFTMAAPTVQVTLDEGVSMNALGTAVSAAVLGAEALPD